VGLVKASRPKEELNRAHQLLKLHGHEVVHLPPCMFQFNAVELLWA
jgi:hypothetical protein